MTRLGIYGGTFDPIHCGHLLIAEWVREACPLDRILFIPSAVPPHKQDMELTDARHRLAMVRRAVAGNPAFEASDIEMQSEQLSYTADTLELLQRQVGREVRLFLIVGEDNLYDLPNWHEPQRIIALAHVLVARRSEKPSRPLPDFLNDAVTVLDSPRLDISSTMIRSRVRAGRSIRYLVPAPVEDYIHTEGLYTGTAGDTQARQDPGRKSGCARGRSH